MCDVWVYICSWCVCVCARVTFVFECPLASCVRMSVYVHVCWLTVCRPGNLEFQRRLFRTEGSTYPWNAGPARARPAAVWSSKRWGLCLFVFSYVYIHLNVRPYVHNDIRMYLCVGANESIDEYARIAQNADLHVYTYMCTNVCENTNYVNEERSLHNKPNYPNCRWCIILLSNLNLPRGDQQQQWYFWMIWSDLPCTAK